MTAYRYDLPRDLRIWILAEFLESGRKGEFDGTFKEYCLMRFDREILVDGSPLDPKYHLMIESEAEVIQLKLML